MTGLRVLIGCERSGVIRREFEKRGHDAWSCDFAPSEDGSNRHLRCDVREAIHMGWDLLALFHTPCPMLCNSGSKHLYIGGRKENGRNEERFAAMQEAAALYRYCRDEGDILCRAMENPVMHRFAIEATGRGYTQFVHPYFFGDPFFKLTGFELVNLPDLVPTDMLSPPRPGTDEHKAWSACHRAPPGPNRAIDRARTYPGIAAACAAQFVWPKPTHAPANDNRVLRGELLPYRTAAECIDWTIECPSIFERKRELAEATKRRIAHGVMRYVVNAAHPFIVGRAFTNTRASRVFDPQDPLRTVTTQQEYGVVDCEIAPHITKFRGGAVGSDMTEPMPTVTANGVPARPAGATPLGMVDAKLAPVITYGQHGGRNLPVDGPIHTIAASKKDTNGIIVGSLAQLGHGERRPGEVPRDADLAQPLSTTLAGGGKHAAVTAFLSSFYGSDKRAAHGNPESPLRTVRAGGQHHAVVAAHIEQANGGPRNRNSAGRSALRPLSTATTTGSQQRIVETTMIEEGALPPDMMARAERTAAFLVKYYSTDGKNEKSQIQPVDRPLDVVTDKARFAVVTVTIDARTYVIVDIGLRMLKPPELARAQGFPDDYVLDPIVSKCVRGKWVEKRLTIAEQISGIGNSVSPPVACALVAANQPHSEDERLAA